VHRTTIVRGLTVVALAGALLVVPAAASATTRIYVNKGVGTARLGQLDTAAALRLGRVKAKKRDSSYAGRVVWVRYFGTKSGGKYALELYSNKSHRVFAFVINRSNYVTSAGIHVGSSESALTSAYGSALSSFPGPVYNRYSLGGSSGTDFYCRGGVVTKIMVRRY
jgi:hypothetical protein